MEISIVGKNLRVTDTIENHIIKKLDRLDRYLPNISYVRIELSNEHTKRGEDMAIAQITVRHQRGAILRAEERIPGDILPAIDSAVDNMYRRIQRFKGNRQRRKGQERFTATLEELNAAEAIPDFEEYVEEAPEMEMVEAPIARRKEVAVSAMNETEAIEQMELLGHNFFLFFNDATDSVNVLYRRTAGGYGVLVPQVE
jgi:putative sigma-54 modulation protein